SLPQQVSCWSAPRNASSSAATGSAPGTVRSRERRRRWGAAWPAAAAGAAAAGAAAASRPCGSGSAVTVVLLSGVDAADRQAEPSPGQRERADDGDRPTAEVDGPGGQAGEGLGFRGV